MTKQTIHIPTGYKPSPFGPIPEDWEVKRLGEVGEVFSGGTPNTEIQEYWNGNIDWCTPTDITLLNGAVYIERTALKITDLGLKSSSAVLLPPNSIIVCTRATIGNAAISLHQIATNQGFKNIVPNENIDTLFLYYTIVNNKTRLIRLGNGSTFLEVSKSDFENLTIPVPPLPEQRRIVSVLSLWDTAISKQTALIEKLTLRKRGLMQQLLTGKKRLKGFEGEWKEVRLGDVASINRGGSPRPIEKYLTKGDGYNWIKIGDVGVNAKYITNTEEKIVKEGLSKTRFVKSGDFILSNSMSFGRPYILKIDGCIHDGWLVIQEYNKTFDIDFLYYILGYDTTLAQYKSMAAGSGVLNLNKEIVKEVILKTPSIDEQKAIASILINADKEIEIANEKLLHMQEEKRGLMQVLLTGKRRVK